jgi:hypothetical protein
MVFNDYNIELGWIEGGIIYWGSSEISYYVWEGGGWGVVLATAYDTPGVQRWIFRREGKGRKQT